MTSLPLMLLLVPWVAFCALAAAIARERGRSAGGWFLLSMIFSPLFGLVGVLGLRPLVVERAAAPDPMLAPYHGRTPARQCPHCHTSVHAESTVCMRCEARLPALPTAASAA